MYLRAYVCLRTRARTSVCYVVVHVCIHSILVCYHDVSSKCHSGVTQVLAKVPTVHLLFVLFGGWSPAVARVDSNSVLFTRSLLQHLNT